MPRIRRSTSTIIMDTDTMREVASAETIPIGNARSSPSGENLVSCAPVERAMAFVMGAR